MPHDDHNTPTPDDEADRLEGVVRQLILMRETGPKSAAWHRARVHTIWRLQRAIEQRQQCSAEQNDQPESDQHQP